MDIFWLPEKTAIGLQVPFEPLTERIWVPVISVASAPPLIIQTSPLFNDLETQEPAGKPMEVVAEGFASTVVPSSVATTKTYERIPEVLETWV